VLQHLTLI
jgi:hypothetical protein